MHIVDGEVHDIFYITGALDGLVGLLRLDKDLPEGAELLGHGGLHVPGHVAGVFELVRRIGGLGDGVPLFGQRHVCRLHVHVQWGSSVWVGENEYYALMKYRV